MGKTSSVFAVLNDTSLYAISQESVCWAGISSLREGENKPVQIKIAGMLQAIALACRII